MNIIVTGASKGIGYETVLKLNADPNIKILAIARNRQLLENLKLKAEYPRNIEIMMADLGNFKLYNSTLLQGILKSFTSVDVLINNAGLLINKPFAEISDEDLNGQININFKVPFKLTQLLLPYLKDGSHVVNISSMGGVQGSVKFPGLSVYSASKAALAVLTESMALELKEQGIKVNCLALGAAQTEMLSEAFPGYEAPLQASEMGKFVADFAISGQKYFNGKILPVALSTP